MFHVYRPFRLRILSSLSLTTRILTAFALAGPLFAAREEPNWNDLRYRSAALLKAARLAEAEDLLTTNIVTARQRGEVSTGMAEALSDLGALYHDSARFSAAERAYKESIFLWERVPGTQPNHGTTLGNFAALRLAQGRPSDALKLYRRAAHVLGFTDDTADPKLIWISCGMANAYWETGRRDDAKRALDHVLTVLPSPGHESELALALFQRAKIAWEENQLFETEQLIRRAIGIWKETLGPLHSPYSSGLTSLAVLISKRNPDEAEQLFRQSLEVTATRFGPGHVYEGYTLVLYARHLKDQGRKSEANKLKRRGEEILARHSRDNSLGHTIDVTAFAQLRNKRLSH